MFRCSPSHPEETTSVHRQCDIQVQPPVIHGITMCDRIWENVAT